MSERKLLDRRGLQKALGLRGVSGRCASGILYGLLGLGSLNRKYPRVADLEGPDFCSGTLREMGISYEIPEGQIDNIPAEGGFLTVSNHHYGGADGLILDAVIGSRRPDYKILTTFLLAKIDNLKERFIPVDNFSSGGAKSVAGIRQALDHLASGGALGLFPAGEVATWQKGENRTATGKGRIVEDRPWPENIVKMIRNAGLPVVPVYFDGGNSTVFHLLGRIHPILRTLRLPRELVNKNGRTVKVRMGKPIPAEEVAGMDIPTLGRYLRSRCYALEAQCVDSVRKSSETVVSELAAPVDPDIIRSEMARLEDKVLFQTGDYKVYLIDAQDAPAAMQELYRLREETFRSVGEGTGKPFDTDEYDAFYKHLILWNVPNGDITGAYRVGYGPAIYKARGIDGFYTSTLLDYGPDAANILPGCMELGRSFITAKYQREVLPLKLMLSGLTVALKMDPETTCCTGTVSISNSMPDFYKSLAVYYIERDFKLPEGERFARPTHAFQLDFLRVNPEDLLQIPRGDIDALDRLLSTLSDGNYRLPVLLRKYFSCGARVACFNVDPLFFNSLDGMIVLKMKDFPPVMLRSIDRSLTKELQEAVYLHFFGTANPE